VLGVEQDGKKRSKLGKIVVYVGYKNCKCCSFPSYIFELLVGVFDTNSRSYVREFRRTVVKELGTGVRRLGIHSPDCSIAEVSLFHRGSEVNISFGRGVLILL
jgi:hypothetical protein